MLSILTTARGVPYFDHLIHQRLGSCQALPPQAIQLSVLMLPLDEKKHKNIQSLAAFQVILRVLMMHNTGSNHHQPAVKCKKSRQHRVPLFLKNG